MWLKADRGSSCGAYCRTQSPSPPSSSPADSHPRPSRPWITKRSSPFCILLGRYQVLHHHHDASVTFRAHNSTRSCAVYRIPPLSKNEGHRANDWGNLAEPLWKGRMRIVEKGTDPANILFEDASTGAHSPHTISEGFCALLICDHDMFR